MSFLLNFMSEQVYKYNRIKQFKFLDLVSCEPGNFNDPIIVNFLSRFIQDQLTVKTSSSLLQKLSLMQGWTFK